MRTTPIAPVSLRAGPLAWLDQLHVEPSNTTSYRHVLMVAILCLRLTSTFLDTAGGVRDIGSTLPERSHGTDEGTTGVTARQDTTGDLQDTTSGSENTFARDRGGPTPGNQGPHQTSIANKLDPRVDSDGDGKPRSGPDDFETTTGPGSSSFTAGTNDSSYSTGQSGTTGEAMGSSYENTTGQSGIGGQSIEPSYSQSGTAGGPSGPSYNSGTSHSGTETREAGSSYDNTSSQSGTIGGTSGPSYDDASTQSGTTGGASDPSYRGTGPKSSDPNPSTTVTAQQGGQVHPHHSTDKTGVIHKTDANSGAVHPSSTVPPSSSNEPNVSGVGQSHGPVGGVGAVEPSVSAKPESGANIGQKQQGADRPGDEPSGEQVDAIKDTKAKHEGAQAGDDDTTGGSAPPPKDPNDHAGDPLGTVDHGAPGQGQTKKEEGGKSEEKGTGEKWVKTTGVAADGGDFDAKKPGAGKEAEREFVLLFLFFYIFYF